MIFYNINEKFTIKIRSDIFEKNSGNSGSVRLGKCSLTAAIPVISVMGVQAVPLPTAVLSNQTGYPSYFCDNYTEHMEQIMDRAVARTRRVYYVKEEELRAEQIEEVQAEESTGRRGQQGRAAGTNSRDRASAGRITGRRGNAARGDAARGDASLAVPVQEDPEKRAGRTSKMRVEAFQQ